MFVLDHRLQGGLGGPPKWDPRARVGIYLGRSPCHAGNVALVLNPRTGHISPQYHVVFDDDFTTVSSMREGTVPNSWGELVRLSSECATIEQYNVSDNWNGDWNGPETDAEGDFKNDDDHIPGILRTSTGLSVSNSNSTGTSSQNSNKFPGTTQTSGESSNTTTVDHVRAQL